MIKKDLIKKLAEAEGITKKQAKLAFHSTSRIMEEALCAGHRIEIRGFGVFDVRTYRPFRGVNPRTSEEWDVYPKRNPRFKASKLLFERLNDGKE
jgi:nucleoid DNA-binding protein